MISGVVVDDQTPALPNPAKVGHIGKRNFLLERIFCFPFEPLFKAPAFHWLPRRWRLSLVQWRKLGQLSKAENLDEVGRIVDSARILDAWEFGVCFPTGIIHRESVLGLTKLLVAVGIGDRASFEARTASPNNGVPWH